MPPTHSETDQFRRDLRGVSPEDRAVFRKAIEKFVEDLRAGGDFRASLRVKSMKGAPGILELTWEGEDGRATFEYGEEQIEGETHVIWRRVGRHSIFVDP